MAGVRRFEDLVAWRLAYELNRLACTLAMRPIVRRDRLFHDQLVDAGCSAPRNLAEGFGHFHHREFARFSRIAKASELEVLNHFIEARDRRYLSADEFPRFEHAAKKALKAVNGLIRYLESTPDGPHKR
jgi:four helix bundle protein